MHVSCLRAALLVLVSLAACLPALAQTTVTLQEGLNGYASTTDAVIVSAFPDQNTGSQNVHQLKSEASRSLLIRFGAIFASQGGPVPDGATITSATLSLYKFWGPDAVFKASRLLRAFSESNTTWNVATSGTPWGTPGAFDASDVSATPDGQASIGDATGCSGQDGGPSCWLNIDVTSGVQAFAGGTPNHGWKVAYVSGSDQSAGKEFNSSENTNWPSLRPKLTMTFTAGGCTKPTAQFNTLTSGLTATFDASGSANGSSPITSLRVLFGDGQEVTWNDKTVPQAHTYAAPGTYNATLTATNSCGTSAPLTQPVTVGGVPTADFTATQTDGTTTVVFDASSSSDNGATINNLVLEFGDGQQVTWNDKTIPQSHTYANPGPYTPRLTVSNANGTSAPKEKPVTVAGVPIPDFTATQTQGTLTVVFNAASTKHGGATISNLRLEFGDGEFREWSEGKDVPQSYTYATPGPKNITLIATNSYGSASNSHLIPVGDTTKHPSNLPASGLAVPTFHNMSLYYNGSYSTTNPPPGQRVFVRYRRATDDPSNAQVWKEGYPLWYDVRTTNPGCGTDNCGLPYTWRGRGSVVHLHPGTEYVFEVGTGASYAAAQWHHHIEDPNAADPRFPATWPETPPETPLASLDACTNSANVACIPNTNDPYVISVSGTPPVNGTPAVYKVHDGWNGTDKNVVNRAVPNRTDLNGGFATNASHAIVVRANYVIVRRVRATGAAIAGIYIAPGFHDVIIEDSDVDDWAWQPGSSSQEINPNSWTDPDGDGEGHWGRNQAGGIHLDGDNSRIVVQRNTIKAPHFGSFPWDTGVSCGVRNHPLGPNGITLRLAGQQNVVRYNDISGHPTDLKKWYLDGIGSADGNFSETGTPGADSDIYQNIIMHVFDDAIQAEGGGRNVRVWGNYIDHANVAVAATSAHFGPLYVWRNVVNRLRKCYQSITDTDIDFRRMAFKYGGRRDGYGDGIRYLFHNTLLQKWVSGVDGSYPEGAGRGAAEVDDGGQTLRWTIGRNNIFHVSTRIENGEERQGFAVESGNDPDGSDFAYNLWNERYEWTAPLVAPDPALEFGGDTGRELDYKNGHGWPSVPALGGNGTGSYQLDDGTFGRSVGTHLPNFTMEVDDVMAARRAGFNPVPATAPQACNGTNTVFAFAFRVAAATNILVRRWDGTAHTALVNGTDYTVTLNPVQTSNPGGTITTIGPSSPCGAPRTITIMRTPDPGAHEDGGTVMRFGISAGQ